EGPRQGGGHLQAQDGQRVEHAFPQRGGSAGVGLIELAGERCEQALGLDGRAGVVGLAHPLLGDGPELVGQFVPCILILCCWRRWNSGLSNTSFTARDSAFAPSRTASTGLVTSRPRSRSPVIRSVTRVAFSVEPSSIASGVLGPVDVDAQGDHAGVLAEVHP